MKEQQQRYDGRLGLHVAKWVVQGFGVPKYGEYGKVEEHYKLLHNEQKGGMPQLPVSQFMCKNSYHLDKVYYNQCNIYPCILFELILKYSRMHSSDLTIKRKILNWLSITWVIYVVQLDLDTLVPFLIYWINNTDVKVAF